MAEDKNIEAKELLKKLGLGNVETIFDYNPTETELKRFNGIKTLLFGIERGAYNNPDNRNYDLGLLFSGRGDLDRGAKYFNKIENKAMLSTLMEDF